MRLISVTGKTNVSYFKGCLVLLFCLATALCRANLLAATPLRVQAGSPHARLILSIYNSLPALWRSARKIEVEEVSGKEMDRLVARTGGDNEREGDNSLIDGCYESRGRDGSEYATITLRKALRTTEVELVFTHEYGHYVWDEVLDDAQQNAYRRIWQAQRRAGHLITEYAADMDEEGFAEAFAYFIRKPRLLKRRDPQSYEFFVHLQRE